MRVLHINTKDIAGGAARATYRLHHALIAAGHESHILCAVKQLPGEDSSSLFPGRYGWMINCILGKLSMDAGLAWSGYPARLWLEKSQKLYEWADVVVAANLHGWFFPLDLLPSISSQLPLIWRLHDMWPATGFCTYSFDCNRWRSGCGKCPWRRDYPSMTFDWTAKMWRKKRTVYAQLSDTVRLSSPSRWLRDVVGQSPLTEHLGNITHPNGISIETFCPGDRSAARAAFGLSEQDRVIMCSYASKDDAWRKGDDLIASVLEAIPTQLAREMVLLVVGEQPKRTTPLPVRTVSTGYLNDEQKLVNCYNAADVFLNLSRADNLPNCLVEAAACGLPAVTLDNGGCGETVIHGTTGFAVKNAKEATEASAQLLSDSTMHEAFADAARQFACDNFSDKDYAQHIIELATSLQDDGMKETAP